MTREDAIQWLTDIKENITENWSHDEAIDMAIEALQAEETIVIQTGQTHGKSAYIKELAEVVRCKDCRWWEGSQETKHNNHLCNRALDQGVDYWTRADDFCSYGERKDNG